MLFEKPYTEGDVFTLKLITGDEVIAIYVDETDTTFTISKPMVFVNTPQGAGLLPFVFTAEEGANLPLDKSMVLINTVTLGDMAKEYLSKVTGLQMATNF